ncbi:MAG: thioredoxin family protein [Armatimonadetes bacterium]|nr:thioredoxin family protein [Armatimonadota bacterium]
MKRIGVVLMVLALAAAWLPAAHAEESPLTALRTALQGALAQGDVATARQEAHKILQAAAALAADKLTAEDQWAIGLAHVQVGAELVEQAVQSGKLSDEQAAQAEGLLARLAPSQPPVIVVAKGEKINLEDYLVAGKTTIVDFYSEYCPPCRALSPHLEKLTQTREDIRVVKVDINRPGHQGIDWGSPAARQFGLQSIPHLQVYGPDKQLQAEGETAFDKVLAWCGLQ